jgi:thiol-disulfide isomerase/thioredoxin
MSRKLIVGTFGVAVFLWSTKAAPQKTIQPGNPAPEFKLRDLNGKLFNSSQLKGSVVLLDLWATWCEPCIAGIPTLNRLHEKFVGQGLKVIGIAVQSGEIRDIKPHVSDLGIKYPVLVGTEKTMEQYVPIGFPITYLIGKDGRIIKKYLGTLPDQEEEKEMLIQRDIGSLLP